MQGVPVQLLEPIWRVLRWTLKHPFILRPAGWCLLLALWLGIAFGLAAGSVPAWPAAAAMAGVLAVILVALFGWNRLLRASNSLIIFLSRFGTVATEHNADARTHAVQIRRRLEGCQ